MAMMVMRRSRVLGFGGRWVGDAEEDEEGKKKNEEKKGRGLLSKPVQVNRAGPIQAGPVWFLIFFLLWPVFLSLWSGSSIFNFFFNFSLHFPPFKPIFHLYSKSAK